jgi:1-deoxyxylulose-5-phosphate synthase
MRYVKLGTTGLDLSPVARGCATYGEPARGYPSWTLLEDDSRALIRQPLEAGINFFDTARPYSNGSSAGIARRALHDFANLDEVVVATTRRHATRGGPNPVGLSSKAIFTEVDGSLKRLSTNDMQPPAPRARRPIHP